MQTPTCLWTEDGARLQRISSHTGQQLNWLFLPGGPGLGSEALAELTQQLSGKIPGVIWHLDLPNDGSNILPDKPLANWQPALIQAVTALENVVLIAHSTPGMYVQTVPVLEKFLRGLVLIGTAPDDTWQTVFAAYYQAHIDKTITQAEKAYTDHPGNETLRKLVMAGAKFCFTDKAIAAGKEMFARLPINYQANLWSEKNFAEKSYRAAWIPRKIPALIMAGAGDVITPLDLYRTKTDYQRKNILLREISAAGHYPWFENPQMVIQVFQEFVAHLAI